MTTVSKAQGAHGDLYAEITDHILADLESGTLPWVQPWAVSAAPLGMPANAATGRGYSGINILLLWVAVIDRGFSSQRWLTFRQAIALGGHVRKGERGTMVVFADTFTPEREKARRARGRRTGAGAVPQALHGVQSRPMRRSAPGDRSRPGDDRA